jgi:hypothetical protein
VVKPVITPDGLIVAIEVSDDDQIPPEAVSEKVVGTPRHIAAESMIGPKRYTYTG